MRDWKEDSEPLGVPEHTTFGDFILGVAVGIIIILMMGVGGGR